MPEFVAHIVPGLAFSLLGLWHTISIIRAFKQRGPTCFTSRPWYPFSSFLFNFKRLELLAIISFSIFAIASNVVDYHGYHPSSKPMNLEHATMFLHLIIYASIALAVDVSHQQPEVFSGLVGILASSAFGQELLLLHFHSADHVGLEGHYHWLLQLAVWASLLSTVATVGFPSSFPAALVRSMSILLQGFWFINMGFMLWAPKFIPKGCYARGLEDDDMRGAVFCETDEARHRAMALANLQFSWILAGIMIFVAVLCLTPDRRYTARSISIDYEKLSSSRMQDMGQILGDGVDGFKQLNRSPARTVV
ncbi:hypothetical protein ACLOJK_025466 [Asimina triloba]